MLGTSDYFASPPLGHSLKMGLGSIVDFVKSGGILGNFAKSIFGKNKKAFEAAQKNNLKVLEDTGVMYSKNLSQQEIIDKLINYYETQRDRDNLNQIYSIAHELSRQAERLRAVASKIEESEENYHPPLYEEDEVDGNSHEMEEK